MKKIWIVILFSLFLVGCDFSGQETTETPVEVDRENFLPITTIDELKNLEMNKSYILMNDLDLTDIEWEPIGSFTNSFLGIFDGNDKTISNLTITDKNAGLNGLFAKVSGDIKDLSLTNVDISYETDFLTYAGALAGVVSGEVENIYVEAMIDITNSQGNSHLGLLAGLSDCQISDINDVAGFLPKTISDVEVSGEIIVKSLQSAYIGGIIGSNFNYKVTNNIVDLVASSSNDSAGLIYLGGIIGSNYQGIRSGYHVDRNKAEFVITENIVKSTFTIDSENLDVVSGGLIGYNSYGILNDNFSNSEMNISAKNINASLLISEDWHSEITDIVASGTIVSETEGLENVNVYKGLNYEEVSFDNSYWYSSSFDSNLTTEIDSLTEEDFYVDNLNWETSFIQKIIEILN
jgi:hypothetical protein